MLVSCLMSTYGRWARVSEALACFLAQDYNDCELIILNNHPEPLIFEHPKVQIVNEPGHPTLGHCRNRLLNFARGELCRTWDDDDLYMPWAISQGVQNIGDNLAWKPQFSWGFNGKKEIKLVENAMEASVTWETDAIREIGYGESGGDEHVRLMSAIKIAHTDVGPEHASYAYKWGCGEWHISGSLGADTLENRTKAWYSHNTDVRPGVPLVPQHAKVLEWFELIAEQIKPNRRQEWRDRAMLPHATKIIATFSE